jgi:hypothetical protein
MTRASTAIIIVGISICRNPLLIFMFSFRILLTHYVSISHLVCCLLIIVMSDNIVNAAITKLLVTYPPDPLPLLFIKGRGN